MLFIENMTHNNAVLFNLSRRVSAKASVLGRKRTFPLVYVSINVFVDRYGAGYDLAARRKNATRESTATLKAWLNEHKKNPYPTKGEKIMLAIITKMTLTQVSTWFANARRRLKKENKMTWEPKNKTDDDDDTMLSDEDKDKDEQEDKMKGHKGSLSFLPSHIRQSTDTDKILPGKTKVDSRLSIIVLVLVLM